ncbi:Fur family transcriptional regulator [Kutzneria kofuensis]|uniref:Fur family transcriptional regulator n=1 Tax=Kutzneria kofuensis TaxID=103725 RepID=UPI00160E3888|nr:Fur family transcriptional regulator [Kutzneria kofuensis]
MATDGSTVETLRRRLRTAGLRVTAPRLAVLEWLSGHPHTTADQVATGVRDQIGSVSTQAVYDVLNACVRADLVRRIEPAGSPARFETRTGDNHHHLVCRSCGRTEDVDCVVGPAPCLEPSDTMGFEVAEAEVVFWGYCPDCKRVQDSQLPTG